MATTTERAVVEAVLNLSRYEDWDAELCTCCAPEEPFGYLTARMAVGAALRAYVERTVGEGREDAAADAAEGIER